MKDTKFMIVFIVDLTHFFCFFEYNLMYLYNVKPDFPFSTIFKFFFSFRLAVSLFLDLDAPPISENKKNIYTQRYFKNNKNISDTTMQRQIVKLSSFQNHNFLKFHLDYSFEFFEDCFFLHVFAQWDKRKKGC